MAVNPCIGELVQPLCVCIEPEPAGIGTQLLFTDDGTINFTAVALALGIAIAQQVVDNKAIIMFGTRAAYDGGVPVFGKGYARSSEQLIGRNHKITGMQLWSCALNDLYNKISKISGGLTSAFTTGTALHYAESPANTTFTQPISEDISAIMEWNFTTSWADINLTKCVVKIPMLDSCEAFDAFVLANAIVPTPRN